MDGIPKEVETIRRSHRPHRDHGSDYEAHKSGGENGIRDEMQVSDCYAGGVGTLERGR